MASFMKMRHELNAVRSRKRPRAFRADPSVSLFCRRRPQKVQQSVIRLVAAVVVTLSLSFSIPSTFTLAARDCVMQQVG